MTNITGIAAAEKGITFQHQNSLPRLPIPPLQETLERYLLALEPLQTPRDHARTKAIVDEFQKSGEGESLHKRLQDYAKDKPSYIEEFWDESYLNYPDPVVLSLNPFFILEDDPTPSRGNQLNRASSLILASLGFIHDLRTEQLQPDMFRKTPLCMHQYSRLFGTARIPTEQGCKISTELNSKHIVVMRRGQMYYFDVFDSQNRQCLTERELLLNLKAIVSDADKTPSNRAAQGALGVLSTENRKVWAHFRDRLALDPNNKSCMNIVDTALFIVCLDDYSPKDANEMSETMLCGTYQLDKGVQVGTCTNRYYDKLQIIVAANGAAGINFEHSGVDGHTVLRFAGDVYTELILKHARSINSSAPLLFHTKLSPHAQGGPGSPKETEDFDTTPKKLEWNLTPDVKLGIRFAETRLSDLICQNEIATLEFNGYGKNFITRHNFSPDAFVQMAYQAAYYILYGRIECVYEPAMTKAFYHGRTEAVRPVTNESSHFVKTFASDAPNRLKIDALRQACKAHVELTKKCSQGQGQDRVLYAMYCLAQRSENGNSETSAQGSIEEEDVKLPAFFRDSGYANLNHSTLSTSSCGNPALKLFGFAGTVPDGFGIGYIIKDDSLAITASSKHLQTQRFLDTLKAYLLDAQKMIIQLHREANAKPTHLNVEGRRSADFSSSSAATSSSLGGIRAVNMNGPSDSEKVQEYDEEEDVLGGYGFFDAGNVDRFFGDMRKARRAPVGTRLEISEY